MLAAVEDVEHRDRQRPRPGPAEIPVQRAGREPPRRRGRHASETPRIAFAPSEPLFGVPSRLDQQRVEAGLVGRVEAVDRRARSCRSRWRPPSARPCRRSAPCRRRASSTASWAPVDAPDGTAARPTEPSPRTTSTSIVGLPRESRISRASTTSIVVSHRRAHARVRPSSSGRLPRRRRLAIQEHGDARQLAALEELERGAAAGR